MKIRNIETFRLPPRWLLLRIETDDGITGWGEPVVEGRAATTEACIHELKPYLEGCDPRNKSDRAAACASRFFTVRESDLYRQKHRHSSLPCV